MKLSECIIGIVVQDECYSCTERVKIGHIVGLTSKYSMSVKNFVELDDVIPLVKFVGEETPRGIHHGNLKVYKD